ncbi:MAG: hypothetical protein WCP16_07865 [Pseudanabaena sp. ELA645]
MSDWWQRNQLQRSDFDKWMINFDGNSTTRSDHTQFIKRMVELLQKTALKIGLSYYHPITD